METLTCKMCGSTNLKKEGDEYTCLSCGTKYHYNDFIRDNGTENCDNEELNDELQRLKAHLREDYSLADRILRLDAGDPEAFFVKYRDDIYGMDKYFVNEFIGKLKAANLDQKDKEEILTYWIYGLRTNGINEMNNIIDELNTFTHQIPRLTVIEMNETIEGIELLNSSFTKLGDYFQDFNNSLLLIMGDDYSDFVDAQMATFNTIKPKLDALNEFIPQLEERRKQLREQGRKELSDRERKDGLLKLLAGLALIIGTFFLAEWLSKILVPDYVFIRILIGHFMVGLVGYVPGIFLVVRGCSDIKYSKLY